MAADQHDNRDDAATPPAASESMDPGFTLRQLDLFVAAAEHGGFAPAAQARHLSPNSVAQAVTDLERRMQTRLVLRHRARGITPTPRAASWRRPRAICCAAPASCHAA